MKPPSVVYVSSSRELPTIIPTIEHHGVQDILRIYRDGSLYFRGVYFHVTEALKGDTVGITEIEDDIYQLSYGPLNLGYINHRPRNPTIHLLP